VNTETILLNKKWKEEKMKTNKKIIAGLLLTTTLIGLAGCTDGSSSNTSTNQSNGVSNQNAKVKTDSNGLTAEQENVKKRLEMENQPGAMEYFYAFSPSDNTYFYATVQGKVSSSGKSLTPTEVTSGDGSNIGSDFNGYSFDGQHTGQVMGQDGTYGQSAPYLYFFDPQGNYYQYYINSAYQIIVSQKPIAIPSSKVRVDLQPTK